jgi:hypothetical protein
MPPLTPGCEERIALLFAPDEVALVRALLEEECGNNLPLLEQADSVTMDRYRFAVLKLSGGDLGKLDRALRLAKIDWRDLLMGAGFGYSVTAHLEWQPEPRA